MRKVFVLMFFLQLSSSLFGQKDYQCYIDFETNWNCYEDTLIIDYISNPNNVWEIGIPTKPFSIPRIPCQMLLPRTWILFIL